MKARSTRAWRRASGRSRTRGVRPSTRASWRKRAPSDSCNAGATSTRARLPSRRPRPGSRRGRLRSSETNGASRRAGTGIPAAGRACRARSRARAGASAAATKLDARRASLAEQTRSLREEKRSLASALADAETLRDEATRKGVEIGRLEERLTERAESLDADRQDLEQAKGSPRTGGGGPQRAVTRHSASASALKKQDKTLRAEETKLRAEETKLGAEKTKLRAQETKLGEQQGTPRAGNEARRAGGGRSRRRRRRSARRRRSSASSRRRSRRRRRRSASSRCSSTNRKPSSGETASRTTRETSLQELARALTEREANSPSASGRAGAGTAVTAPCAGSGTVARFWPRRGAHAPDPNQVVDDPAVGGAHPAPWERYPERVDEWQTYLFTCVSSRTSPAGCRTTSTRYSKRSSTR